jgi:hypothetical protein
MFSYVNASLYDSNSFSSPGKDLVKSLTQLNIGADEPTSSFFKGKMDEFKIYNAALSSSQIKQNYIAGLNSLLNNGNMSKKEYEENINKLLL